jgi:ComF family protein
MCIGCKAHDVLLCKNCKKDIIFKISKNQEYKYIDTVYTCCRSSVLLRKIIHFLKYKYKEEVVVLLGDLMVDVEELFTNENIILIPVPLHYKKLFKRGFNQAELLSRYISKQKGCPTLNVLERNKDTQSQALLGRKQRIENMIGAFKMKDGYEKEISKTVILVDDVLTTGSTLDNCAKELKDNGFKKVYGLCLSRGI